MKNNNENLIYISKSIIENLDLKNYISHAKLYKSDSLGKVQINDLKKEALKLATNDFERTYIFVDRVLKQVNLLLLQ
jgi:hypothetical protein